MKKALRVLVTVIAASGAALVSAAPMSSGRATEGRGQKTDWVAPQAAASGLGINVALVGSLTGAHNILYKSAVDVTNNTAGATQVDFYFDGLAGTTTFSVDGSISSTGGLVAQGTGGTMPAHFNAHFDDFIASLVSANLGLPSSASSSITGSVLFVFNGFTKSGQGFAAVRFYNNPNSTDTTYNKATIGAAAKGHEVTTSEPTKLVATCRHTVGESNTPQLKTNLFINNTGLTPTNSGTASAVSVALSAVDAKTGATAGHATTITIAPGLTTAIDPFAALGIATATDTAIVTITATPSGGSGAAIEALVSINDATTGDESVFEAARGDF
jgi:hypothetical protein